MSSIKKLCCRYDLTVGISCINLLSIYLDYLLHLLSYFCCYHDYDE